MKAIVLIPIYKQQPNKDEELSLKQAFKVLSQHQICFICPKSLDTTTYYNLIGKEDFYKESFSDYYFENIAGYSNLLATHEFYQRFKEYDYILIYQLDAWVFYDNLIYWCEKGYDYIGAPWFDNYKSHEEGAELWRVGNGGLSLRKVSYFLKITNKKQRLFSFCEFIHKYPSLPEMKKGISMLLYKNYAWYRKQKKFFWEDIYFCDLNYKFNTPTPLLAAEFSFEKSPTFLYSQIGKLPFGCHAWRKHEYEEFWHKYIPGETIEKDI